MSDHDEKALLWRQRAEEYRAAAAAAKRPDTRDTYLKLAGNYDALADEAVRLAETRPERVATLR